MKEQLSEGSSAEKIWRLGRNINLLGAAAIGGAAIIIPGPNVILTAWAALNSAQAGGFELLRQHSQKKHKKKPTAGG